MELLFLEVLRRHPVSSLAKALTNAVSVLAAAGRPTSQVKMLWVARNLPDLPLMELLAAPLHSDLPWVRADLFHIEKLAHAIAAAERERP